MLKLRLFARYWLPVLVWMAVIFSASSDSFSFQHSSRILGPLIHWLFPDLSEAGIHGVVVFVRKCAHLAEFGILALLLWRAWHQSRTDEPPPWRWPTAARVILVVMLYAASDEFHQLFVSSRQASVVDVLIDTTGALFALLFLWVLGRWGRRW